MKRKMYLDVIKVYGAFAIILLHTLSNTVQEAYPFLSAMQCTVIHSVHQLLFTAVPMFLLATGAGFLAESRACSYRLMKKHILKILCCILVFGALFWTIECILSGGTWNLAELCRAVLIDATWSHMWYLYRILGIYLLMPILSAFMNHSGIGEQLTAAGILLFFECFYPYIAGTIGFLPATVMPIEGILLFYVLAGGIIERLTIDKLRKMRWVTLSVAVVSGILILAKGAQGAEYILLEDYPLSLIYAVCVFVSVKIWCEGKETSRILSSVAQASLGIYILHPALLHFFVKVLKWNPQYHMPMVMLPLMALSVLTITYLVVVVAKRIPIVRKIL
uniref:acyltransferase n=1 Tax=Acetatifactor sp. TaxID=1872090 RepID=UPI004055D2C5